MKKLKLPKRRSPIAKAVKAMRPQVVRSRKRYYRPAERRKVAPTE